MRFRFSGHESFPCRYTWLPKAYQALNDNPLLFADDNQAMVRLGVGKNMVKAIRFWALAFNIAKQIPSTPQFEITFFGHTLLKKDGLDPFLEDIRTLWLLHWKISTIKVDPLFAWYFLLNQWADPTFSRSEVIQAFGQESDKIDRPLSDFTKEQHFDIFLHTYVPRRPRKTGEVFEDTLDCPLTELQIILPAGERIASESGKREVVYEFRQDSKAEITESLFTYCLFDFWRTNRVQEASISLRDVSSIPGSIGQIFKISEADLRARLESLEKDSQGLFKYLASAAVPRVVKHCDFDVNTEKTLLDQIYGLGDNISHSKK